MQPLSALKPDPEHDDLQDALHQLALVDEELRAVGDLVTLGRFGEPEAGFAIAESLGHVLLTSAEARTVDRLGQMPDGAKLVRTYLRLACVPRAAHLEHVPDPHESVPVSPIALAREPQSAIPPNS